MRVSRLSFGLLLAGAALLALPGGAYALELNPYPQPDEEQAGELNEQAIRDIVLRHRRMLSQDKPGDDVPVRLVVEPELTEEFAADPAPAPASEPEPEMPADDMLAAPQLIEEPDQKLQFTYDIEIEDDVPLSAPVDAPAASAAESAAVAAPAPASVPKTADVIEALPEPVVLARPEPGSAAAIAAAERAAAEAAYARAQAPVFDGPGDVGFDASSFQPNQLSATRKISDMIENGDQVDEGFVALPADMMAPLPSLESEPQSETARIEPEIDDALLDSTLDTEEEFMMPDSPPEDMLAEPEPAFEPAPRDEPVRAAARAAPQPLYRYRAEAGAYELESAPDYAALPDAPMAAADAAAARNVAAVQPASSSSRYRAVRGADVRETLDFWSRDAGVALMWLPDWVADVRETVDVSNSYENAVQALLDQYGNINGGRVVGTLYVDPATKQKTLVVEHKS